MKTVTLSQQTVFVDEPEALSGVRRVAKMVCTDLTQVVGAGPMLGEIKTQATQVIYGTLGHSPQLTRLSQAGVIDHATLVGKREVYQFKVTTDDGIPTIVIAGSDKRGTIYGLFHLSTLLGVSPFVNWAGLAPKHQDQVVLDESADTQSQEPSVRYRGFFINDEWPAFGNWATRRFGGVNAKCYAQLFELLLRLKGNYLWPAMWSTNFSLDGPGLASAELASELGVVMSTSHHEPCMRSGEEYLGVRGPHSIYGDAWDFQANPDGITRFWRDGLRRNAKFENVITLGMRGERDTALMKNASLKDNIAVLERILHVQNDIIKAEVSADLSQVPRQIVMFNEVESFFYGDADTPGLAQSPELDDVCIMYSDNNVGFMRTLPPASMRAHKGGFGMYYHMDMHGGPASYEWIGSTALSRVWHQMTTAYEAGVQEIWVVNVGDLATNELSLSYFLDLAYDYDHYGVDHPNETTQYLANFVHTQFNGYFDAADLVTIRETIADYQQLLEWRKHEVMNVGVFDPVHHGETDRVLALCAKIINRVDRLQALCPTKARSGFELLVGYPAKATANLMQTWLKAGLNHYYAKQNRVSANTLADAVKAGIAADRQIVDDFHNVDHGRFDGFGLSEHFGFRQWNAEDNQYPVREYIEPANLPRLIVAGHAHHQYSIGTAWVNRELMIDDALRPDVDQVLIDIACGSRMPLHYAIGVDQPWVSLSRTEGEVGEQVVITATIDRKHLATHAQANLTITSGEDHVIVHLPVFTCKLDANGAFLEVNGIVSMAATHARSLTAGTSNHFIKLAPYGKFGSALITIPPLVDATKAPQPPIATYAVTVVGGDYALALSLAPTAPMTSANQALIGVCVDDGAMQVVNTVQDPEEQYFNGAQWRDEAINNEKRVAIALTLSAGRHSLKVCALSPNLPLEWLTLVRKSEKHDANCLGYPENPQV